MNKNVKITICSPLQARARAKAYNQEKFVNDYEIFGISDNTFEKISKLPFTFIESRELVFTIINEMNGEHHIWHIPKIFIDIEE